MVCCLATGCASPATRRAAPATSAPPATTSPSPSVAAPTPSPAPSPRPSASADPSGTGPAFAGTASALTAADLPSSWHPGCPVSPAQLTLLHLSYWGFDSQVHAGTLVVNTSVRSEVLTVFATLFRERFPIHLMQPVDAYGGSDSLSAAADNTSGFNCRYAVASGPPAWSAHAYGEAIDVNDVENPYIEGGVVTPTAGAAFLNRSAYRPGMAVAGGQLVAAFASVGWLWGGRWAATPDYQHFSRTGG